MLPSMIRPPIGWPICRAGVFNLAMNWYSSWMIRACSSRYSGRVCWEGSFLSREAINDKGENAQKLFNIKSFLQHPWLITSRPQYEKLCATADAPFAGKVLFTEYRQYRHAVPDLYPATEETIAFIQFSSGSTGQPKGVVLTHGNLLGNIYAGLARMGRTDADSYLNWMPLTHDMGLILFHLYPLAAGVPHFIMPTDLFIRHPLLWMRKIAEHRVTITGSPNFGYKYYLDQLEQDNENGLDLSSLRVIINGAEPVSAALCRRFTDTMRSFRLDPTAVRMAYGLAEATLIVTLPREQAIFKSVFAHRKSLTIGHLVETVASSEADDNYMEIVCEGIPLDNLQIKLLDRQEGPLAEGHMGIIWVKGDSVTSGFYHHEKASRQVIRDGWLNTGDTGFLIDGELYVMGRVKDIIIVHGSNVYPHDIEQTVETLDEVGTGKVVACGIPDGETSSESIVLFVLFKSSAEKFLPLTKKIKNLVANQLGLAVKHVLPVRKIAKTTSGKVKRFLFAESFMNGRYNDVLRQLADLQQELPADSENDEHYLTENDEHHIAVRTDVASIFGELLHMDAAAVGIYTPFIELGADSLVINSAVRRIEKRFKINFQTSQLFGELNTPDRMARYIAEAKPNGAARLKDLSSIQGRDKAPHLSGPVLSYSQERLWFIDQLEGSVRYNERIAFRLKGPLNQIVLNTALHRIVVRHEVLRTVVDQEEGRPFGRLLPEMGWLMEIHDASGYDPDAGYLTEYISQQVHRPFDLTTDYMLRALLIKLNTQEHILLLIIHHIAMDRWSARILVNEWVDSYNVMVQERSGTPLPLTNQYTDFAIWQRRSMSDKALEAQLHYWKQALADAPPLLLPYDKDRQPLQSFRGTKYYFRIGEELTRRLQVLSDHEQVTPFMTLLAVFKILLYRYSGQEDICVGTSVSGRPDEAAEKLIGFFINTLVLRSEPDGNVPFTGFLQAIRTTTLAAYDNQDLPFEKVVEAVEKERDLSRSSLFQVLFEYFNAPLLGSDRSEELECEREPVDHQINLVSF